MKTIRSLSLLALLMIVTPSAFAGQERNTTIRKVLAGTAIGVTTAIHTGIAAFGIKELLTELPLKKRKYRFIRHTISAVLHAGNIAANQAARDYLAKAMDKNSTSGDEAESSKTITTSSAVVSAIATIPALGVVYYM